MTEQKGEKVTPQMVVRFERIGRNRNVPDMPIVGDVADADNVAEQVWKHARGFLESRDFDVEVTADGRVSIEAGRFGGGSLTPERPCCVRCEVPIYQDQHGVWRREATGVADCPRNPANDGHEPLSSTSANPTP